MGVRAVVTCRDGEVARVVAPSEDSWDAEPQSDGTMRYVATVTEARLLQIEAASEVDDSHAIVATPPAIAPTLNAHYVGKSTIVDAVVAGGAVRALCGRWFVPKHDPGDLPICRSARQKGNRALQQDDAMADRSDLRASMVCHQRWRAALHMHLRVVASWSSRALVLLARRWLDLPSDACGVGGGISNGGQRLRC